MTENVENSENTRSETMTLKPGILVSLKSSVRGGITYERETLPTEVSEILTRKDVTEWKTKRTIEDAEEHDAAIRARSAATAKVRSICVRTSFGLLCLADREEELDKAVAEARVVASEFNGKARYTRVTIYVLKGRIAETDQEAAGAIATEVQELLEQMGEGIASCDVAAVRDAANKAKGISAMLEGKQAEAVSAAVAAARTAARQIVKRIEKGGEDAAAVLLELQTKPIETARFAMLDMEPPDETEVEGSGLAELPGVDVRRFQSLDDSPAS